MSAETDGWFEKAERWRAEARAVRAIILDCGVTEDLKWGKPCYAAGGKNIAILQPMKDFLALLFFKGALLDDPDGLLERQGPNSRSGYRMRFTGVEDVAGTAESMRAFVRQAVEAEKAGLSVDKPDGNGFVDELVRRLDEDPELKAAFEALTPGRQRGYNLYFAAPKQSATRAGRIEKYRQKILDGKGFHDR